MHGTQFYVISRISTSTATFSAIRVDLPMAALSSERRNHDEKPPGVLDPAARWADKKSCGETSA
jgi:hypothetical protein